MYNNEFDEMLTIDEVGQILYCGKNTVYRLLSEQEIHGFKIGSVWKIPSGAVKEYLARKQGFASQPAAEW